MATHFDNLAFYIPNLKDLAILDLGSGRGNFLIESAKAGARATGLEMFDDYIRISHEKAKLANVTLNIVQGTGEHLPFPDSTFNFVNMGEVIEHVESPEVVLREVHRVLKDSGLVYVSAPNRFGLKDTHFHLYFVNFLPRSLANAFISVFGKHKDYNKNAGRQKLDEMHYYTLGSIKKLAVHCGFNAVDMRTIKIEKKYGRGLKGKVALLAYCLVRPWYFDTYHVLLSRVPQEIK